VYRTASKVSNQVDKIDSFSIFPHSQDRRSSVPTHLFRPIDSYQGGLHPNSLIIFCVRRRCRRLCRVHPL